MDSVVLIGVCQVRTAEALRLGMSIRQKEMPRHVVLVGIEVAGMGLGRISYIVSSLSGQRIRTRFVAGIYISIPNSFSFSRFSNRIDESG